jgi:uncharacterized Rmd1/YagE family protein
LAAGDANPLIGRALLLGERLDTRRLDQLAPLATAPLAIAVPGGGTAVLFRFGAVIIFGAALEASDRFLASLRPLVTEPFADPEREQTQILVYPEADQNVDPAGNIVLQECRIEQLQIVADIPAKSLVLAHYESGIAGIFDRIEPLAARLRREGSAGASSNELLRHIGNVLGMQQRMVGRVEISEKPELLWEHPQLERLYMRLADVYEVRERDRAIDRKLEVISRTVETLLGLVQTRSSLRVEWYIVILIVAELLLALYELLLAR